MEEHVPRKLCFESVISNLRTSQAKKHLKIETLV